MRDAVSAVRLLALAWIATVALAAGCGGRPVHADASAGIGGGAGQAGAGGTFTPTRKIDMLFVIDDSGSTRLMQDNLLRNFPVFVNRLSEPPGLPDLRIAVVSTDLGAGDGSVPSCDATGGRNGIFHYTARGTCTSTGLDPGATYIADDGVVRNHTGNLADVFTCIGALGNSGCGFSHALAAAARALGANGQPAPAENRGFLREDAFLFIMILTNEDDCSAPPGSGLFDTVTNTNLASPLGPVSLYRCSEFGHLCGGKKPPRLAPNGRVDDRVTLDGCVSAEGAGMLTPVATVVAQLRALKPFPDQQIVVAAIVGPTTPYTIAWRNPGVTDTGPWPVLQPSCVATDGSVGLPSVRIAQWVQSFGANGLLLSVCDTDFAPSLDRMAQLLNQAVAPR
jgi:hypothetical protein